MDELLALDIGTGTVIGFLGRFKDGKLELLARAIAEYPEKAIEEGRIVDVEIVAKTVRQLVKQLSEDSGCSVKVANFAVPGRGLRCMEKSFKLKFANSREITAEDLDQLNRKVSRRIASEALIDKSAIEQFVDDQPVKNLLGQFGQKITVRYMLTTLDMAEIETKKRVIEKAGLVAGQLVLEPRAAVEAAFPPHEFKPSIGVLDFGAGTIDAALIEDNRIKDFTTVLGSGDKLTRELADQLLVDFAEAEGIKRQMGEATAVNYRGISGEEKQQSVSTILGWLNPLLHSELEELKDWVEERRPVLFLLAGGGAAYPGIEWIISRTFGLQEEQVIRRGPRLKAWVIDPQGLLGSTADYTAYGILLMAAHEQGQVVMDFTLNGEQVKRLAEPNSLTAGLLLEELDYSSYEPHPDSIIMFSLDAEWITESLDQQLNPRVKVNGHQVDHQHLVRSGDEVEIIPPDSPQPLQLEAADYLPEEKLVVFFGPDKFELPARLIATDGTVLMPDDLIEDGAEYQLKTDYQRSEIISLISQSEEHNPPSFLWKIDGVYSSKRVFSIGQQLVVEPGVDSSNFLLTELAGETLLSDQPFRRPLN